MKHHQRLQRHEYFVLFIHVIQHTLLPSYNHASSDNRRKRIPGLSDNESRGRARLASEQREPIWAAICVTVRPRAEMDEQGG